MSNSANCPQCGAPVKSNATTCKFCGGEIARQLVQQPIQQPVQQPIQQPVQQYVSPQQPNQQYAPQQYQTNPSNKNKVLAGLLAIFLGAIGVHKFYLGKIGTGIVYLIFSWTYIPAIIGFVEGIIYLTSTDEKFYQKYVAK